MDSLPEVTVTVAYFVSEVVPEFEYVFEIDEPEPDKLSVPVQEYVYEPEPPEAETDQVVESPLFIDDGFAEQEAVTGVEVEGPQLTTKRSYGVHSKPGAIAWHK